MSLARVSGRIYRARCATKTLPADRSTITPATLKAMYQEYGLGGHQSAWGQYFHYWGQLLHGNLGISTSYSNVPVATIIGSGIFWTLGLVGVATVISFLFGTLLGIVVAWRRGK